MIAAERVLLAQCVVTLDQLAQQRESPLAVCALLKAVAQTLLAAGGARHIEVAAVAADLEQLLACEPDAVRRQAQAVARTAGLRQSLALALR